MTFDLIATDEYGVNYIADTFHTIEDVLFAYSNAPEGSQLELQLQEMIDFYNEQQIEDE